MRRFLAAVGFLTIIPLPRSIRIGAEDHGGSAPFYPLVGLFIGAGLAGLYWGLKPLLPPLPSAVLVAAAMSMVSGGLHIDGLADTADGFMSGKPKDRALEIMADSRMGPMGGFVMFAVLAAKISALAVMDGDVPAYALLLAAVAGRSAMSLAIVLFPYVRPGGLGAPFAGRAGWGTALIALSFTAGTGAGTGFITLTQAGYFMAAVMPAWTIAFGLYCKRRIGGMTGDAYGALCETMEAICLLIVAGYIYGG